MGDTTQGMADLKRESARVVRHFHRHSPEARANLAASHRAGFQQKRSVGSYFYTHPDLPGLAFDSCRQAACAAVKARTTDV